MITFFYKDHDFEGWGLITYIIVPVLWILVFMN